MMMFMDCFSCKKSLLKNYSKSNIYRCDYCGSKFFYREIGFYHMNEDNIPDYVFSNVTFIGFN